MVQQVLAETILGASLLLTTSIASPSAPMHPGQTLQKIQDYHYVVQSGDTLKSIAKENYGSEDYWTTIWNDNPEIENPQIIEVDQKLSIRFKPPMVVEFLNEPLQNRHDQQIVPTHASVTFVNTTNITQIENIVSPTPSPSTTLTANSSGVLNDAQLTFLGTCESGMTATRNSGNGFYGAFQFMPSTWRSMNTGYERADMAPLEVQKDAVQRLLSRSSIHTQFPGCARKMQAAGLL